MSAKAQSKVQPASMIEASFSPSRTSFLQRKCACGGNSGFSGECEECRSKRLGGEARPLIQPKLKISQPGDKFEQEADRVAEEVMRMPEPTVQRQVDDDKEEEIVQAKRTAGETSEVTPTLADSITYLRGGGQPLDQTTRVFMEPRFGYDFSKVRVHADAAAAVSAQSVNARAYTVGQNIVFATGQYATGRLDGRMLLAHELTHVMQQAGRPELGLASLQRQAASSGSGTAPGSARSAAPNPYARSGPSTNRQSKLPRLTELLMDGDEEAALQHIKSLSTTEKKTVRESYGYRELVASTFNDDEMYIAVEH